MNEQNFITFLSALGEEFCEVLSPVVGEDNIVPQDAFEVFERTFNQDPSPQLLAALTTSQLEQLRTSCEKYFECQEIPLDLIRGTVSQTLLRCPADET